MTLSHKTRFNTSGQGFKKDPIRYQCYLYKVPPLTPFLWYGKHCVERPFRLLMKLSEAICFYLPRSRNEFYVVVKKNAWRIDGGR